MIGDILLRNIKSKNQKLICSSHYDGRVTGLELVPEHYILTTGEDNRIMLWNMETNQLESYGEIDDKIYKDDDLFKFNQDDNEEGIGKYHIIININNY